MPAYADLVRIHHATVFRVALGVLRDSHAAEDVTQDVFLSFLEDPGPLDRADNLLAFVCRTSLNRALDVRKAGKRRAVRESAFNERRETMDPMQSAFRSELRAKVAELPEDQRQAVDLHYFQGLTLREAGLALEIPEGTVSSRISAALGRLRTALGAAAFAGLLAMLESELGKCSAQDVVPADLPERLMHLRPRTSPGAAATAPATGNGPSSFARRAGVAAFFAVVLMLALLPLRALFGRGSGPAGSPARTGEVASAKGDPAPAKTEPAPTAPSKKPASPDDPALLERAGFVVEFFHKGKICVDDCKVPEPLTLQEFLEGPGGHIFSHPPMPPCFEDPGPLRDAGVGDFGSFAQWLEGNQAYDRVPRVWVKVKYQLLEHSQGDANSKCVRVLERDELSRAWLEAWQELARVNGALRDEAEQAPGQEKRRRLLELEARLTKAMASAHEARPNGALAAWSRERERSWASASAGLLRRMGCGRELPAFPTEEQLTKIALRAANPGALHDDVVAQFGEEALEERALFVLPSQKEGESSFNPKWFRMSELSAMSVAEFDSLRTRVASVSAEQWAEALTSVHGHHGRPFAPSPRAEALGIHGEQLEDFDAERLALESGVEVKSVDAGSAAANAGLKAGDVLWKVMAKREGAFAPSPEGPGKSDEEQAPAVDEIAMLILNARWLETLLENEEAVRPGGVKFLIVRGGEVLPVEIRR